MWCEKDDDETDDMNEYYCLRATYRSSKLLFSRDVSFEAIQAAATPFCLICLHCCTAPLRSCLYSLLTKARKPTLFVIITWNLTDLKVSETFVTIFWQFGGVVLALPWVYRGWFVYKIQIFFQILKNAYMEQNIYKVMCFCTKKNYSFSIFCQTLCNERKCACQVV